MTTKQWILAILGWWLVIFVWYVWFQEWSIATGTKIRLQTRPIDPTDFFRGDYVILGYDISNACNLPVLDTWEKDEFGQSIKTQQYHDDSDMTGREKMMGGKLVYVPLIASGDVMVANGCVSDQPTWVYLKGLRKSWSWVEYGIEKYFVQQGTWKPLENAVGNMKVQVSVGRGGQARIVDYRLE